MNNQTEHDEYIPLSICGLFSLVSASIFFFNCISFSVHAREYFNPLMLEIDNPQQGNTDLTIFEEGNGQASGVYRVDIYINNQQQETQDIEFKTQTTPQGKAHLQPCLSVTQLNSMGIKTTLFPELEQHGAPCANLSAIPQASAEFHFSAQQLLLSIPQSAIAQNPRGYVPETQWDDGIPALLLNYNLSGASTVSRQGGGNDSSSQYANLRPGINVGPWRLRNYTTFLRDSHGQPQWDMVYTYLNRDIRPLHSQLMLGDSTSPADVFDSVPFRGVQLASDDDMIPDSLKGYAPVVRGIARTHAQVIIRQNGYVIYQSYVAPGSFEINDMYATGGSGDLYVTIKEADGSEQLLVVPFASLPVLQRESRLKYSLTSGQYRAYDSSVDHTPFGQGTLIYGLPHGFTAYGGGQFASKYHSLALGIGKNLGGIGALSLDVTQAWSRMQEQPQETGQSWRVRYSKNIVLTGTNFAIAGYRYSTDGYYSMQEVLETWRDRQIQPYNERKRNRTELTMSQNLWEGAGSLSLSLISEDYWKSNRTMRSTGIGYNNSWNGISYGLNYNLNENTTTTDGHGDKVYGRDRILSLNVSIPLSRWAGNSWASWNLNHSQKSGTSNTLSLNGTALADNRLSWGLQQGYGSHGTGNSGALLADYRATYGEVNAGYAYDARSRRLNYGVQGGMVMHAGGATFGQPMGETVTLVQAPGASGIGVSNQTGVKTDWRGYALIPFVNPYRKNQIQLDTETFHDNTEVALTSQTVIPTRGAVVKADFQTSVGNRLLMTLLQANQQPVPFGAIVTQAGQVNKQSFIVGENGQVYLTGLGQNGQLHAKWGKDAHEQCIARFSLPEKHEEILVSNGRCQ